jgi:TonB-linked SusC/RagA family outer membrane protein
MKKNRNENPVNGAYRTRFLTGNRFVMLLAGLLFCTASNVFAFGQAGKFTFRLENATVKEVLQKVKDQGGISFVFNEEHIARVEKVTINVTEASLETVLDECLKGSGLGYQIMEDAVVIRLLDQPRAEQQRRTITGTIKDETGSPMPGVNIVFKVRGAEGFASGVNSDVDGKFSIIVPDEPGTLLFTFVGYEPLTVDVTGRSVVDVSMAPSSQDIKEVVVTGIFTRKASSYTGSASTVQARELQQFGNVNVITSLRNVDPSFNIIESNTWGSNPNRLPEIQIRGNSSIPNVNELQEETRVGMNTPLIILDGFQTTLQKLLDINENEVESITILKDASATAIYGSRGANGVVVITTKAPEVGRLRVTYRSDLNIEVPDLTAYSVLNAREKLDLELMAGLYNSARAESDVPLKRYYNDVLNEVNSGVDTYWLSQPLRTGVGQRHNLRLEGGDQSFRYSASAQVNNIQGVMKGSSKNVFNGTINLTYYYNNLKFTNSLMLGISNSSESPYGSFSDYVRLNPYWRAYDEEGNVIKTLGYYGNTDYTGRWSPLPTNPLFNATLNTFDLGNSTDIVNNTSVEWNITEAVVLRGRLGFSKGFSQSDNFKPADHTSFANYSEADFFRKGSYGYGVGNSFSYDASLNLSYSKVIAEKHSIYGGLDYNMRQNQNSNYSFLAEGFTNAKLDFLSMALQYAQGGKPSGTESLNRAVGFTGNMNYTYDNRYSADVSLRTDGSSQFGTLNRFAPFWSTGLSWNLDREAFFNNITFVDRLKLRGSVGTTGSQNFSSYQALSTYRYYTDDRYFNWLGSYMLGLGNDKLKWQQKMNYNLGVETSVLKSRVSIVADVYRDRVRDLVSSVDLPASNGFTSYIENIGKMQNSGFEIKATTYIVRNTTQGLFWSVTAAAIRNRNKVVEISQALKDAQKAIETAGGANPNTLYREGYSVNTIWVVESLGIDPSSGKEIYLTKDGETTFIWSALDLKPMGVNEPKIQGNLNTTFRYKAFSTNISFGYRVGGQMYNQTLINKVENADFRYNVDSRVYDSRWQMPGDVAAFKGLLVTSATNRSSRFVQDENTLTCQNINLRYDLESSGFLKNMGVETLTLSGNTANLFYVSSVKQERGTTYPFARQFSFSVLAIF